MWKNSQEFNREVKVDDELTIHIHPHHPPGDCVAKSNTKRAFKLDNQVIPLMLKAVNMHGSLIAALEELVGGVETMSNEPRQISPEQVVKLQKLLAEATEDNRKQY